LNDSARLARVAVRPTRAAHELLDDARDVGPQPRGICLGLESIQGTDALLDFVGRTTPALRPTRACGVLYKAPKPGQDRRLDLPAIGPSTVECAAAAGLAGIAVEAGGVMVLGFAATVAAADAAGLFLWARGNPA